MKKQLLGLLLCLGSVFTSAQSGNLIDLNKQVKNQLQPRNGGCGTGSLSACIAALLPNQNAGTNGLFLQSLGGGGLAWTAAGGGGGQVYPIAGIALSTGSAWTTSIAAPSSALVGVSDVQTLTHKTLTDGTNVFPTFNQNTTGTAANLAGTPALPNGTSATTQVPGDGSTKIATDAFVLANAGGGLAGLTNNFIPKSTSSTTLGNSACNDTGSLFACSDPGGMQGSSFVATGTGSPDIYTTIATPIAPTTPGTGYSWFDGTTNHLRDESFTGGSAHIGTTVEAYTSPTHQFLTGLSTAGVFISAQPQIADINGGAPSDSAVLTTSLVIPATAISTRGTSNTGPPPSVIAPALSFVSDPNYGLTMVLNGNEIWPVTAVQVTSTTVIFSLTTPINGISWAPGDCFQLQSLPNSSNLQNLNGQDIAVTSRNGVIGTSTITVTIAGTANSCQTGALVGTLPTVGTYSALTATAEHYAMFLSGHTLLFNRLTSSSQFCPTVGTIRICDSSASNSDKVYGYDPTSTNSIDMLQRWTGSGPTTWTQIGDASYGAIAPGGLYAPSLLDANGNKEVIFTTTASAVDYFNFTNSATGTPGLLTITAAGTDSNIAINIVSKGSGGVLCNGSSCTGGGGGMVYPGAGIPNSTGSAWTTSYTTSGTGTVVALTASPIFTNTSTSTIPLVANSQSGTTADIADFQVNGVTKGSFDTSGMVHSTLLFEAQSSSGNESFICGNDGSSIVGCTAAFRGADHTSASGAETAGVAIFRGGNNNSSVNSANVIAGGATLVPGLLTNATPGALATEGSLVIDEAYKGAGTLGTLACYSGTAQTIQSCASIAANSNWVGIIQQTSGGSQGVTLLGTVNAVFDTSITAVAGDLVCVSTTGAGTVSDVSLLTPALASCPTPQSYVGRVKYQTTGGTTSAFVTIDPRSKSFPTGSDLGTISYVAAGTTTFAASGAGAAGGVVTAIHSTSTTLSPIGLTKWGTYSLEILEDSTGGSVSFALGTAGSCSAWKVTGAGAGAITLTSAANSRDLLTWTFDGTNCIATFRANAT